MPKVDTINAKDLAAQYGWALSVLKSDPSLNRLFNRAVKQSWAPQRFVAELRSTRWFRTHSEASRNAQVLRRTDPATWKQRFYETRAQVGDMSAQLGSRLTSAQLSRITNNVLNFGWNDAQIKGVLAGSVRAGAHGTYGGQAAVNAEQLREVAQNNGVKVSDTSLRSWLQRITGGEDMAGFEAYIRGMAAETFPTWAEQLKAGQDVKTLADPYVQQMAATLEINPAEIDLFTPEIRKALQSTSDASGKPLAQPMWAFEQSLKQDQRWRHTDGARNELDAVGKSVLKDFGLVS